MIELTARHGGPQRQRRSLLPPAAPAALLALSIARVLQPTRALAAQEACTLVLVAADPASGQIGYGVLSCAPAGTAQIGWTRAGVGAAAVLGTDPEVLALRGLGLLARGVGAEPATRQPAEAGRERRRASVHQRQLRDPRRKAAVAELPRHHCVALPSVNVAVMG